MLTRDESHLIATEWRAMMRIQRWLFRRSAPFTAAVVKRYAETREGNQA